MRSTGCLPAAFVIVALLAVLGYGALQQELYLRGLDVNLKLVVVVAASALLVTAGAVAFFRLRRINRP